MNINVARKVDFFFGYVLSLLMKVCYCIFSNRVYPANPQTLLAKNILIIKFFGLGSILQMSPMLKSLKNNYPMANITLLTFSQNNQIAKLIPAINNVVDVDFDKNFIVFVLQTIRNIIKLRRNHFDIIFNCEFFSYFSAIMTQLIRVPQTITVGFRHNASMKEWIFSYNISMDNSQHISKQFFKMLLPLNIKDKYKNIEKCNIAIDDSSFNKIDLLMKRFYIKKEVFLIVVNINAGILSYNRRWPMENYKYLMKKILQDQTIQNVHIFLIGGTTDKAYVDDFMEGFENSRIHNLAAKLNLSELAALLSRSNLFIGNDSGPLHLACFVGTRTVSFFGPETPKLYGPLGEKHHVFYSKRYCSPCLNIYFSKKISCSNNECMQTISPEEVFKKVRKLLPSRENIVHQC